jgi:hypothetical protein
MLLNPRRWLMNSTPRKPDMKQDEKAAESSSPREYQATY